MTEFGDSNWQRKATCCLEACQKIDVVIATFNRCESLVGTIESVLESSRIAGGDIRIIVVDNNSTDHTSSVVSRLSDNYPGKVTALFEGRQGKPFALNRGVACSNADIIAFVDDDELVTTDWLSVIRAAFCDSALGFAFGRYVARWEDKFPAWASPRCRALMGEIAGGSTAYTVSRETAENFLGGNAAVRRELVLQCGGFNEMLNYCEDMDFGLRLFMLGAKGRYLPSLVVTHLIPADRTSRAYVRRRAFWNAVGVMRVHVGLSGSKSAGLAVRGYLISRAIRDILYDCGRAVGLGTRHVDGMDLRVAIARIAGLIYGACFDRVRGRDPIAR